MEILSNNNDTYSKVKFRAITLNQKEKTKSMQLLIKYASADTSARRNLTTDLFKIFNKKIQEESHQHTRNKYSHKDILQDMYLCFLESIVESLGNKNPLEYIIAKINGFKPNKNSKKTMLDDLSIDKPMKNNQPNNHATYADIITHDFTRKISEQKNNEEEIKQLYLDKDNIDKLLTVREQEICNIYLEGNNIPKIAKKLKISKTRVREHFAVIISKIRDFYNIFDEQNNRTIQTISSTLSVNETALVKKIILKLPSLQKKDPKEIIDKINKLSKILGIKPEQCVSLVSKYPNLIVLKPETIQGKIDKSSELLNIDSKDFKKIGLKSGSLLYADPQRLNDNAEKVAEVFNVSKDEIVKMAMSSPNILITDSQKLKKKIQQLAKVLNISEAESQKMYRSSWYLLSRNISSLINNMRTTAKLLKINYKDYLKLAVKKINLIYQAPTTIYNNVVDTSKHFNISTSKLINSYKSKPQLFIQKPQTIQNNVKKLAELLKISLNDCLELCLSSPQLFYQSPTTIYSNAVNYAKLTNKSLKEVIKQGVKMPNIFMANPANTVKKKEIIEFYALIRNKEHSGGLRMNSTNDLYAAILRYLIKKSGVKDFPSSRKIYDTTKEYILNHPDKEYEFELPKHSQYNSFVEFSENLSNELLGKNIFHFKEKQ